jgi:hypothetical protein
MKQVKASDLNVGDIIRVSDIDDGYNDSTVINVTETVVYVVRPYVHTSDFTTSAGLISYIGQEEFCIGPDMRVTLLRSVNPMATREKIDACYRKIADALVSGNIPQAKQALQAVAGYKILSDAEEKQIKSAGV